jgi:DNA-binding transcriptional MerR regulator
MKKGYFFLGAANITLLLLVGHAYLGREPASGQSEVEKQQNDSVRQEPREQLVRSLLGGGKLYDDRDLEIRRLEKRLEELEASNGKADDLLDESADNSSNKKEEGLTSKDLSDWMIHAINENEWDKETTRQVTGELEKALDSSMPNVRAEEVNCGNRFCQVTLVDDEGGSVPPLHELMGTPPFIKDLMTTPDPEDKSRLEVLFTREGVSLAELKNEASGVLTERPLKELNSSPN